MAAHCKVRGASERWLVLFPTLKTLAENARMETIKQLEHMTRRYTGMMLDKNMVEPRVNVLVRPLTNTTRPRMWDQNLQHIQLSVSIVLACNIFLQPFQGSDWTATIRI